MLNKEKTGMDALDGMVSTNRFNESHPLQALALSSRASMDKLQPADQTQSTACLCK